MKHIGIKIKEARESSNISRKQLADLAGISPSALANYELGYRKPSGEILTTIADALGVPVFLLLPSFNEGNTYHGLLKEATQRDNPNTDQLTEYIKLLSDKQLTYALAYADIESSSEANKNITKYLINNSSDPQLYNFAFSSDDMNEIFNFIKLSTQIKAKEIIEYKELNALAEKRNALDIKSNIRDILNGTDASNGTDNNKLEAKIQTKAVLDELLFFLEDNGASDMIINSIDNIITKIETRKNDLDN